MTVLSVGTNEGIRSRDPLIAAYGLLAVAAIVAVLRAAQAYPNPTIAALLLLLVVVATAAAARLRTAIALSFIAMLAFNYFLLPPFHTLALADPQNWVALLIFVAVAAFASQLSATARDRAHDAEARRREVARLFDLSRDILGTTESRGAMDGLARFVAARFQLDAVAICLPAGPGWELHQGGARAVEPAREQLDAACQQAEPANSHEPTRREATANRLTLVPLRLGTRPLGVLAADGPVLERGTLDALASVVALAIERGHFLEERARAEALRQRAELASALLASFSHDLRTPLTAVRLAVGNLQDPLASDEDRRAQAQLALSGIDRLNRLFEDILDMARIDAAAVTAERQWVTPADLVEAAVAYVAPKLDARPLVIEADSAREVQVDPRLTSSALAHLLENAAKYSSSDTPIEIRAEADRGVRITVRDHGPGIDPAELDRLAEPFYRSARTRTQRAGLGLGLAITRGLLAAEGGRVWGENARAGGAQFTVEIPAPVRPLEQPVE